MEKLKIKASLALIFASLFAAAPLAASTWYPIGPFGGLVTRIVADPHNPGVFLALSFLGGVYKTADGGATWVEANTALETTMLQEIVADPHRNGVFYAAAGYLYRSDPGGSFWRHVVNQPMGDIFPHIWEVDPSPTNPDVVFAVGAYGAYRTIDGGATWDCFLPASPSSDTAGPLLIDPRDSKNVYVYFRSGQNYLLKASSDGGVTWGTRCVSPPSTGFLYADPSSPQGLFSPAGQGGINYSPDGGATWTARKFPWSRHLDSVHSFWADPAGTGILLVGTIGGLLRSPDNGLTWELWETDVPPEVMGFMTLCQDPSNAGTFLAGTVGADGVYKTADGGKVWTRSSNGLRAVNHSLIDLAVDPNDGDNILISTRTGIRFYRSADRGVSWSALGQSIPEVAQGFGVQDIEFDATNAGIVYAATTVSLHKSTDSGATWTATTTKPTGSLWELHSDPATGALFAGCENGLWRSSDRGDHWTNIWTDTAGRSVLGIAVDPADPQTIVVSLVHVSAGPPYIFKTTNGGTTWEGLGSETIVHGVKNFAMDPNTPSILYAGNEDGLFKSTNGGTSWSLISGGLDPAQVRAFALNPADSSILYVGMTEGDVIGYLPYGRIYQSTDGGTTWQGYDDGIDFGRPVSVISLDPSNPSIIYAGSEYGWGVYTTVDQATTNLPRLQLDRNTLIFGAAEGGGLTPAQKVTVSNSGQGTLAWNFSTGDSWISFTPSLGIQSGTVSVSVNPAGLAVGEHTGQIYVYDYNALDSPQYIQVKLTVYGQEWGDSAPPFGLFETPAAGATVAGSVPVTGWALDDIGVAAVKIFREPLSGEGSDLIYIGDAVFVEGARPDVETTYPGLPSNSRAGWGYMLLTNMLPGQGNGPFVLHAIATDLEGLTRELWADPENHVGITITCANAGSHLPFGTIDTPAQGGTASGSAYMNFGWVLTPLPNAIPTDGSTIQVWMDGVAVGHPVYNNYRADIAGLFPGLANSNAAVGYFALDTTAYIDGLHNIAWGVRDNAGNEAGIGSRYFRISNAGSPAGAAAGSKNKAATALSPTLSPSRSIDVSPIGLRNGFKPESPLQEVFPDSTGTVILSVRESERIEIDLEYAGGRQRTWRGGQRVGQDIRSLPVGSTLDAGRGIFSWMPGPGFRGTFDLVFQASDGSDRTISIVIHPRFDK